MSNHESGGRTRARRPWPRLWPPVLGVLLAGLAGWSAPAQVVINEVLFNPSSSDAPNQYIELRGPPNLVLPPGAFFVAVEGYATDNPGTIRNLFDLSGRSIGGNGFLVLLQKNNAYTVNSNATILANTGIGAGWGSGRSSSIGHRGYKGQTDLPHSSVTFFLLQTTNPPAIGDDIDADDDGRPDGQAFPSWNVWDSVGVLGDHGAGDIAYGAINFRRNRPPGDAATALLGVVVPLGFTPGYVGRTGNTTRSAPADWVASDSPSGAAPRWMLPDLATVPAGFSGLALDHLGAPNFGAARIPGVVAMAAGALDLSEDGRTDSYTLGLNTSPAGPVVLLISPEPSLRISLDGGATFVGSMAIPSSSTNSITVTVKALDDNIVDTSPHPRFIRHSILSTADPGQYPLSAPGPLVQANVAENDTVWLNELKVNPPGTNNVLYQYIEIKGPPFALLTNIYFLEIEGRATANPGTANLVIDLSSVQLGSEGLLVILADGHPYTVPSGCAVVLDSHLSDPTGGLSGKSVSSLLVSSPVPITEGDDLDQGDNGTLEGLPNGSRALDAVGWRNDTNDLVFGGVSLTDGPASPDALVRFPGATDTSATAWFYGDLAGADPATVLFDPGQLSPNFPLGATLSLGEDNTLPLTTTPLAPLSGAVGDPTNPQVVFRVFADGAPSPGSVSVTAASDNPQVVPDANLVVGPEVDGMRTLSIDPVGVGYAIITLTLTDGVRVQQNALLYAASQEPRKSARYHTGASDASTALAVDANLMLEGDDQQQVIGLYRREFSGPPLDLFDMTPYLGLGAQEHGEVDIECSTRTGHRLFWLGSMSNNNAASTRTNRVHLFATDLSGSGANAALTFIGRYDHLKTDLLNWDAGNAHGKGAHYYGFAASAAPEADPKADDGSGFNIEGLTMAPGSATVGWLGFRAPLVPVSNRAKALILPVLNFATLAVSGAEPGAAVFGAPIELNLGCRGIRSFEAASNAVLISAGPAGKATNGPLSRNFKLFTWTGRPTDPPQERTTQLQGLQPEGIVDLPPLPWTPASLVPIVCDDGNKDFYNDGTEAKHLAFPAFQKFRSDWVKLGDVAVPEPCLRAVRVSGLNVTLSWCSAPGRVYRVRATSTLNDPDWKDVGGEVLAVDAVTTLTLPLPPAPQMFYQVIALP